MTPYAVKGIGQFDAAKLGCLKSRMRSHVAKFSRDCTEQVGCSLDCSAETLVKKFFGFVQKMVVGKAHVMK